MGSEDSRARAAQAIAAAGEGGGEGRRASAGLGVAAATVRSEVLGFCAGAEPERMKPQTRADLGGLP